MEQIERLYRRPWISAWAPKIAALVVGCALLAGCGRKPAPSEAPRETTAKAAETGPSADGGTWYVLHLNRAKVGYQRTETTPFVRDGRKLVRVEGLNHMVVPRDGKPTELEDRLTSIETPEGELIEFEVESARGPEPTRTSGRVAGDQLHIQTTTKGRKETASIPWAPEHGGFYAVEQSLARNPMAPGERRTIRALFPELYVLSTTELVARQYEPVPLLTGTYDLLRIDMVITFPKEIPLPADMALNGRLWTDRTGEAVKSWLEAMNIETFRTTRAEALEETEPPRFDLVRDVKVKVDRPLASPHDTKRVRYRVTLDGRDPAAVFVSGPSQKVDSIDSHTVEVNVYALRPDAATGRPDAADDPPTGDDLQPNNVIQSDYPAIVAKARQVAPNEEDPWLVAVALERSVQDVITLTGYSQAFATAAEVIEAREGDCTEHAVLLAALARARGIPARLAIGLVYINQAFYYHMWTEVHVHGRWIPLDATRAEGGIGAAHLKMAHSNFKGVSALSAFLPVIQVIGRLKIEILEAE